MKFLIPGLLSLLPAIVQAQTPNWPTWDTPPTILPEHTELAKGIASIPANVPQRAPGAPPTCTQNPCNEDCGCWWTCGNCVAPDDIVACPTPKVWGLTFDDGPSQNTTYILDYLKQNNMKAMFCVVGSRVVQNPEILKRTYAEGHEICVHTWSHTALTSQSNDQVVAEIKWTEKAIYDTIGVVPKYMRPPFGDVDNRVRAIMRGLGYKIILWNMDTSDWKLNSPDSNYNPDNVKQTFIDFINTRVPTLQQGVISLEHDLRAEGVQQFPIAVDLMKTAGFSMISVGQCLKDDNVYQGNSTSGNSGNTSSTGNASNSANATGSNKPTTTGKSSATQARATGIFSVVSIMAIYFLL
ncbi:chitin deacetylase [Basidiobolus ranarum]|uniref:Chitin deacetylase n=1 Tax=Basidiobolus ranarum TaxID=34480 RepID=A0ABR2W8C8_9FUNG